MQTTIQQFTLSLLAYKGALIEAADRSAGVLLGSDMAAALRMNEYERLAFDASVEIPGSLRVDYDSPAFEGLGRLVESMGRVACVTVPAPELRPIDPERELERTLNIQNGVYRVRECVQAVQLYFCFFLQYDVMADERSGGMEEIWGNSSTHSIPRMASVLQTLEIRDSFPAPEVPAQMPLAWGVAAANVLPTIQSRLSGFLGSLERRRDRDLRRMQDYYRAIDEEIRRKIKRMEAKEETRKGEIDRLTATARTYESRVLELVERYRVKVLISRTATLACMIPTHRIGVEFRRRSAKTETWFSWNPFDRRIERKCCDSCRQITETAVLCDDRVHYLCLNCLKDCSVCTKPFCRACHPRCPRSHRTQV